MACPTAPASPPAAGSVSCPTATASAPAGPVADRDDGIAVAILRPAIVANEPAVAVGRLTALAFIWLSQDLEFHRELVDIASVAGGCTFESAGSVLLAFGSTPGRCSGRVTVTNVERNARTTKTFELEVVQRREDGSIPPVALRPTYHGIVPPPAPVAPGPPLTAATLAHSVPNAFHIKFREGSGVRARAGALVIEPNASWGPPRLDHLKEAQKVLASAGHSAVAQIERIAERDADSNRLDGTIHSGQIPPDPLLNVRAYVQVASLEKLAELMNKLAANPLVERVTPALDMAAANAGQPGSPLTWPSPEQLRDPDIQPQLPTYPPYRGGRVPPGGRPPIPRPPR